MHIGVWGSGYLATVVSACLADFGTPVTCCDEDAAAIAALAEGTVPFFEKNLQEVTKRNIRCGRLVYSTDFDSFVARSQAIFLANDSPRYIDELAVRLGTAAPPETPLVIATPAPVGTAARIEARLRAAGSKAVVVSHPLFLTDGCAIEDFNWPDRIVLGTGSSAAVLTLKQIYRPLVMRGVPVIVTNHDTAELVREASSAFLATKISFINELASLCEHVNADAVDLSMALGLDKRIGPRCLQAGAGFGGAFAEPDLDQLSQLATGKGISLKILSAARDVSRNLSDRIADKISGVLNSVNNKEIGVLGLAFKPHTNSIASSSSIHLARRLVAQGARVRTYDPVAMAGAKVELTGTVRFCDNPYLAAEGSDALVVGTAWPEFRTLDYDRIKRLVRRPVLVDTKNLLDAARMKSLGFEYLGISGA